MPLKLAKWLVVAVLLVGAGCFVSVGAANYGFSVSIPHWVLGLLIGIPGLVFFFIVAADRARMIYGRTHQLKPSPKWDRLVWLSFGGMLLCALFMYLFLPR